jgi:hypothetical protein
MAASLGIAIACLVTVDAFYAHCWKIHRLPSAGKAAIEQLIGFNRIKVSMPVSLAGMMTAYSTFSLG